MVKTVGSLALLLSFFPSATCAIAPPKVVFIGDELTYYWNSGFAAHPNWINQGVSGVGRLGGQTSDGTLASFQSAVVSLHPAIVHIMVGANDVEYADDASWPFTVPGYLSDLDAMVKEAKAANIKVVLGTEPAALSGNATLMQEINAVTEGYGAANNIPVINYGDALCGCVGSLDGSTGTGLLVPTPVPWPVNNALLPSATGYTLMTQMAEATIDTINLTLKSGWLQNLEQTNQGTEGPVPNVNTVSPEAVVQFTAIGFYSDGSQHPFLNTNPVGSSGTWTSSNPLVMTISQQGQAWAISPGTATIRYISPSGVKFSSWVMHITGG